MFNLNSSVSFCQEGRAETFFMKLIDLQAINKQNFSIKEGDFLDQKSFLIGPKMGGTEWTTDNLIFRSSIWNEDGELLSAGFKKFFNYQEKPGLYPSPETFDDKVIIQKIDGSLLICDKINEKLNIRTRGTFSYKTLENASVVDFLIKEFPKAFDNFYLNSERYSVLYEFYDPKRKIVLNYGTEPKMWLVGIIDKVDYHYVSQQKLDEFAKLINVPQPKTYLFNSFNQITDSLKEIKNFEGFCIYFNFNQNIVKLKADSYLVLHRFMSNATLENVVDLFCEMGYCSYVDFKQALIERFDFECWNYVQGFASQICDVWKEVLKIKESLVEKVNEAKNFQDRKSQALFLRQNYGDSSRLSMAFTLLDKKELTLDQNKKLIYQVLKK